MGKADQISSIFWLIFGVAVSVRSYQIGMGALTSPGPGFVAFWSGVILCVLSVVVLFNGTRQQRASPGAKISALWDGLKWPKAMYVLLSLVAYSVFFQYLGFIASTVLLLLFLFKAIEPETWVRAISTSVLVSAAIYYLFAIWLQVQFPRGLVENLIS